MLLHILYIIAITAEAMTAALSAGRRDMDWVGVFIIAWVTALGGGTIRNILLGHYPMSWVEHSGVPADHSRRRHFRRDHCQLYEQVEDTFLIS